MFSFFQSPVDKEQQKRNEVTQRALENGQLPPLAVKRINEVVNSPNHLFTSALSVNENLLLSKLQVRPIAQVMGTAFFKNPLYLNSTTMNQALSLSFNQVMSEARARAFDRLIREVRALKADGVVDVTIKEAGIGFHDVHVEFTVIGTAVKLAGGYSGTEPFSCNLSGADFYKSLQAGYLPRKVIFGSNLCYERSNFSTRLATGQSFFGLGGLNNQEVQSWTESALSARQFAYREFLANATNLHSEGIIGLKYDNILKEVENSSESKDFFAYFSFIGTAVKSFSISESPSLPKTTISLSRLSAKRQFDYDTVGQIDQEDYE